MNAKKLVLSTMISLFLPLGVVFSAPSQRVKELTKEIYKEYKTGNYTQAINLLDQLEKYPSQQGLSFYWKGLSLARLQKYDQAVKEFKRAYRFRQSLPSDYHYEYGQALYALLELKQSATQFRLSFKRKFKQDTSLYYMAYIAQSLEQSKKALKLYESMDKVEGASNDLKQAAWSQVSEILTDRMEKMKPKWKQKRYFVSDVLPALEKVVDIDEDSAAGKEHAKKIAQLKEKYDLLPYKLKNGKKLPAKRWRVKLSQDTTYDNNVTNEADQAAIKASNKDSMIYTSKVNGRYRQIFKRRHVLFYEGTFKNTYYGTQSNGSVYSNDSYNITPNVKWDLTHKVFQNAATFQTKFEYDYMAKDARQEHLRRFFSHTYTFEISEKFKYLHWGDTKLSFKIKILDNYDPTADSDTTGLGLTQTILLPNKTILIGTLNIDSADVTNDQNSTNTYLTRFDHVWPNLIEKITLHSAFGFTLTDTKKQKATRGIEKKYNPSIKISRSFKPKLWIDWDLEASFKYSYTNSVSKVKTSYDYTKHEFLGGLELTF